MIAILKFNLPEEESDFLVASRAINWALVSWDMDMELRNIIKYGHDFKNAGEAVEFVRDKLREIMETHNVRFDDIE